MANPLQIGPTRPPNYQQPDTAPKVADPKVAAYAVGANVLNLTWPIPKYTQPNYPPAITPQGIVP